MIAVGVLLLVVGIVGGLFRPGDQPEAARTSAPAPSTPPDDPPVTMDKFFELREMTKPAALAEASSSRSVGTAEPAPLKLDFDWVVPPEQVASEPVFKMALVVTNHDRTAKLSARVCSNVTGIIDLSYKHFNLGWEGHAGERREIQNGQSEYLTVALYDLPRRKIRFVLPETTYSGPGKHSLGKEQDLVADTVTFDVDFFDANHQRRCVHEQPAAYLTKQRKTKWLLRSRFHAFGLVSDTPGQNPAYRLASGRSRSQPGGREERTRSVWTCTHEAAAAGLDDSRLSHRGTRTHDRAYQPS